MRKMRKKSFADLVKENKQELMGDAEAMRLLEEKIEERLELKLKQAK
ncbi:hypothetical protein JOC78_003096 [Bacillus ectoiniformans]|nr:FbpB family small basic protein [Bacillus ectoiniformans]MBM7650112.1 hypothetical protein [Bacillus ectoiniformans]